MKLVKSLVDRSQLKLGDVDDDVLEALLLLLPVDDDALNFSMFGSKVCKNKSLLPLSALLLLSAWF